MFEARDKDRRMIDRLKEFHEREPSNAKVMDDLLSLCYHIKDQQLELARKTVNYIKNRSAYLSNKYSSVDYYTLYKKSLLFEAPYNFDSYMLYLEFDREPNRRYYLPRRKQLKVIADDIQDIADDRLDLLTISTPPGVGKSTMGIMALTWFMGRDPDKYNLASGHSSPLTESFYEGVMSILTDPEYLYYDIFPLNRLVDYSARNQTIDINRRKRFKTLTCRSIRGTLTGATRCNNILYVDDMVEGIEEATSIQRMDKLWQLYTDNLKSRKMDGCKEIHIATRWSVHDPIGRLKQQYGSSDRARFRAIPALNENNESNFEFNYNVGYSTKYYMDMKDTLDDVSWLALYQNQPIEREGLVFPSDELNRYYDLPTTEPDAIIAVADTAEGGGDSVSLPIAYMYDDRLYIEDVVFSNALPEITEPLCVKALIKHGVEQARFESNNAGGRYADSIQSKLEKYGSLTHITKRFTSRNKFTKIIMASEVIKKHFYFKDKSRYKSSSMYGKFMSELTSFTQTGNNAHDDAPDSLAQMVDFIEDLNVGKVKIMKRPF